MLSQSRDLLEQPLDFYEPDVLPAAQLVVSKLYRKTQWFGRLLFYRHGISTTRPTNGVKELNKLNLVKQKFIRENSTDICTKLKTS